MSLIKCDNCSTVFDGEKDSKKWEEREMDCECKFHICYECPKCETMVDYAFNWVKDN